MSRPRGNAAQRAIFAAVKQEAEARGWTARLDFAQRGGSQRAMLEGPDGQTARVQIHGTPRCKHDEAERAVRRVRNAINRQTKG